MEGLLRSQRNAAALLTSLALLGLATSSAELRAQPEEPAPTEPPRGEPPTEEPPDAPSPVPAPDEQAPGPQAPDTEPQPNDPKAAGHELSPGELAEIERAVANDATALGAGTAKASSGEPHEEAAPSSGLAATAAALLPDIAVILDVAAAYFSEDQNLQTGGHDPTEMGFNLQQLELSITKSVDPYFRFDSNIVLSLDGVEIEEAYATTLSLPLNLQARAGQLLTRFGRINATHPHSWDFVDQPFYLGRVWGGEGNRGLGVELSVLLPLPWSVELVGSTSRADGEETARSFYGADNQGVHSPLDFQNTGVIKQFFDLHEDWSLMWGMSTANGPNPHGKNTRSDVYGSDLYLKYRPITRQSFTIVALQAEWLYRRRQIPLGVLHDTGGYAYLLWRFAQRWATAARYEYGSPVRDAGSGEPAIDPLDADHTGDRHRVSANITFWPTEFSRLRLQGSVDLPAWLPDPIWAAFLAFEVVVGSHGAHPF